jgi:hypothetical protein
MFNESLFYDFEIETNDGEVFGAHKSFLIVHSPVFEAMLKLHDTEESRSSRVKIKDTDGKTMQEMLRFIYTRQILNGKEVARNLLIAADKYQIKGLLTRCCEILAEEVSSENAVELMIIADRVQNDILFQRALDFIFR